ncbi:MAG: DUF3194 domain-containing protein [Halapricum sp.]
MVEDSEVVQAAANAAEKVIFSRCDRSAVADFDVTVTFEDEVLEVDVYLNVDDETVDERQVADDAALAARSAVDELFSD